MNKSKNPLVTVALTNFNNIEYIEEALKCCASQDYPEYEVIVIDDDSNDGSLDVIKKFISNKPNIRLICNERNLGVAQSRNIVLGEAKGKFTMFCDGDDFSLPNRIRLTVDRLVSRSASVCFCDRWVGSPSGKVVAGLEDRLVPPGEMLNYMLDAILYHYDTDFYLKNQPLFNSVRQHNLSGMSAGSGIMTVETEIAKQVAFDAALRRYEDTEFNLRLSIAGASFTGCSEPLVIQNITESGVKNIHIDKYSLYNILKKHEPTYEKKAIFYPLVHNTHIAAASKQIEADSKSFVFSSDQANTPLVTVGMLAFNCETTIIEAVMGALHQDWPNVEVLIYDDCSSDGTIAAIEAIEDSRIRLLRGSVNRGAGYGRNQIVDNARGDYIVFFDDDDVALSNRVRLQIRKIMEAENLGYDKCVCFTDFYHFIGHRLLGPRQSLGEYGPIVSGANLKALVWYVIFRHSQTRWLQDRTGIRKGQYSLGTSLMAGRTSILREYRFDGHFRRMQDLEFLVRLAADDGSIVALNIPTVLIRATTGDDKRWSNVLRHFNKILRKHPDDVKKYSSKINGIAFKNWRYMHIFAMKEKLSQIGVNLKF